MIEDNPADVRLIQEGLKQWKRESKLSAVANGADAIAILRGGMVPSLIILDWNLCGGVGGSELLQVIKTINLLKDTVTVVFTSSADPMDRCTASQLGASAYLIKPIMLDDFLGQICEMERLLD